MNNEGAVAALDVDEDKLSQLEAEMRRLGIAIVSTHCLDLEQGVSQLPAEGFDRILLDAPCSGLGVMRRHPDIKWHRSEKELAKNNDRQLRLLENLAHAVKPDGFLVYAVCSLEPEENEAVIQEFLKKQSDFGIDNDLGKLPAAIRSGINSVTGFTTLAFIEHMDGFFLARLKRKK